MLASRIRRHHLVTSATLRILLGLRLVRSCLCTVPGLRLTLGRLRTLLGLRLAWSGLRTLLGLRLVGGGLRTLLGLRLVGGGLRPLLGLRLRLVRGGLRTLLRLRLARGGLRALLRLRLVRGGLRPLLRLLRTFASLRHTRLSRGRSPRFEGIVEACGHLRIDGPQMIDDGAGFVGLAGAQKFMHLTHHRPNLLWIGGVARCLVAGGFTTGILRLRGHG